jgi:uncharacterized protein YabE (DUF348 family)
MFLWTGGNNSRLTILVSFIYNSHRMKEACNLMFTQFNKYFKSVLERQFVIAITTSVMLLAVMSVVVYESTKATVFVTDGTDEQKISSHAETVGDLLIELGYTITSEDIVVPKAGTKLFSSMNIYFEPAKEITMKSDNGQKTIKTTAANVKELLASENISLKEQDEVQPSLTTELNDQMTISIDRAFDVTFNNGGQIQKVWTTSTTVGDFLEQNEIELGPLDRVEPSKDGLVTKDTTVSIIRVEKVTDVVEEPIDYAVVTRKDTSITAGNERIVQKGEKGIISKHYEVVLENGKEVSRELMKKEVVRESKDQIVAVGTKQLDYFAARSGSTGEPIKEITVTSTAYHAYCKGCSGTTRTGINLRENPHLKVIAVDPSVIPLGTKVYVEGYGYALAADTGGAIKGYKIDVFIPDKKKVYNWGVKRNVKVKIYGK